MKRIVTRHSIRFLVGVARLATITGLAFGSASCAPKSNAPLDEVVAVLHPDLEIGVAQGDPAYEFGNINGIAIDPDGRILVADPINHQIRVFDQTGRALFTFGARGDAPGDLWRPCCIAFDPRGRLWIWSSSDHTLRYDVFHVRHNRAEFAFRIPGGPIGQLLRSRRILFDTLGNVVHPGLRRADGQKGSTRLLIDTTGAQIARVYPPYVPPESLGMYAVSYPSPQGGQMVLYLSGPSTASHPIAHSPAAYADAITSRYSVRWFAASGMLLRVIQRPIVTGPPVSDGERAAMEAKIQSDRSAAERMGGRLPDMTFPTHKHPLDDLFFDLDGRLWVVRTRAASDTVAVADVFDQDGAYSFTAQWPARVTLNHGVITGAVAYGVSRDPLDVASVVRLRMEHPRQ